VSEETRVQKVLQVSLDKKEDPVPEVFLEAKVLLDEMVTMVKKVWQEKRAAPREASPETGVHQVLLVCPVEVCLEPKVFLVSQV